MLFFKFLSEIATSYVVFPILFVLGSVLTWKLSGIQIFGLRSGFNSIVKQEEALLSDKENRVSISRYEALASILAGNFGTGNIAGMAIALTFGGPGSLIWIWLAALLGSVIQFAGSYIGVKYRLSLGREYIGGPVGCLINGLKKPFLAKVFCFFTILTAFSAGNFVQVSSFIPLCSSYFSIKMLISGLLIIFIIPVLFGGNLRIIRFSAKVIPFIALFYFCSCLIILFLQKHLIFSAISMICKSAFGIQTAIAGIGGYTFTQVLSTGFNRAIMATDCGSGLVSILQSDSKSTNPLLDGLVTLLPPVIVMVVCSVTMLVLVVSGPFMPGDLGTLMVVKAFENKLGYVGRLTVITSIALFGYTTMLTWFACIDKSIRFLIPNSQRSLNFMKILFVAVIPLGAIMDKSLPWVISDIGYIGMVVLNCYTIIVFYKDIVYSKFLYGQFVTNSTSK